MRVLVTGATGFLGWHLTDHLLSAGHEVRAFLRASSDDTWLRARGVETVRGDWRDSASIRPAVRGADAIIHAAGGGMMRRPKDVYLSNVDTTENLLAAVEACGEDLKRFVLVSSLAAHGPSSEGAPAAELDVPAPRSHYGKAKLAAERAALRYAEQFPVTVLRPPAVYGPGDTRMVSLFRWARRGVLPLVHAEGTTSLVYGPDVAEALVQLLTRPHPSGRAYFIEDGRVYRRREMAELIAAAVGRRAKVVEIPRTALRAAGVLGEGFARARNHAVVLTRDKVADLDAAHTTCSARRLRDELGWAPSTDFGLGAQTTAEWYGAQGWI